MVVPFSVDSQLSMIVILSRAVELCQVKGYTGGIPPRMSGGKCLNKLQNRNRITLHISLRCHNRQSKVIPNSELLIEQCTELCSCD